MANCRWQQGKEDLYIGLGEYLGYDVYFFFFRKYDSMHNNNSNNGCQMNAREVLGLNEGSSNWLWSIVLFRRAFCAFFIFSGIFNDAMLLVKPNSKQAAFTYETAREFGFFCQL